MNMENNDEELGHGRFTRFSGATWFSKTSENPTVIIGGGGGIGSWLALFLARTGIKPVIYDDDIVEYHNTGGQLFKTKHNGSKKVKAIAEIISEFTGEQKYMIFPTKIDENTPTDRYCFSAFDNMKARKVMFMKWQRVYGKDKDAIFIDGRLGAEHLEILCIQGGKEIDQQRYIDEFLFEDSEVEDAPCSMKQTSHMAGMIASMMCGFFTNFLTNIVEDMEVSEVPFFHSYFLPMNLTGNE